MAEIRIGVSGWSYDRWQGAFYPDGLPKKRRLEFAARQFNSVEINGSFYSLLRPETYANYHASSPDGFVFAVKGSQYITHSKKLNDVATPLANFFASGLLRLEEKLGPVLWQFPNLAFDPDRVRAFLDMLPYDTAAASRLAKRHDARVTGRASMHVDANRPIRHALEFRHESFFVDDVVRMARDRGAALVFSHSGDWRYVEEVTADFVYLRLHGAPHTYASGYGPKGLEGWADRIHRWAAGSEPPDAERITELDPPGGGGRDAYVYLDNDARAYAPRDARRLMKLLAIEPAGRDEQAERRAA